MTAWSTGRYLSYLLRLWQTADGETQLWRASLEQPGSGERVHFASLEKLVAYLEREMAQAKGEGTQDDLTEESGF